MNVHVKVMQGGVKGMRVRGNESVNQVGGKWGIEASCKGGRSLTNQDVRLLIFPSYIIL